MDRRSFFKRISALIGSGTVVLSAYPVLRYMAPQKVEKESTPLAINKEELPEGSAKEVIFNNTPIVVINRRGRGYIALSRVCTHFGCLVGYDKEQEKLICPCHAGVFSLEGNVISGPPPKPLAKVPMKVTGDQILVGFTV